MGSRRKPPIAQHAYNQIAEEFARIIDIKPHNAYYEHPATLSLLGEVTGKRVLDAGCGPGVYAEWLVEQGARVVAVDANLKMIRLARQRLAGKATVRQANLEYPLDFLDDGSFDIVLSALAMDYVLDWATAFREFHRLLRTGGKLIFSIGHPHQEFDAHRQTSNYFHTERVEYNSTGFGKQVVMPSYRRPLSEVLNLLIKAGFTLDRLLEPLPTEKFRQADPEDYEELMHRPGFMCLRALKR
ncbi:MAG: class I SAM-dependent methyltransferase [Anaerolineales bacterium]|nr:MAG: class I SAM-dependent methyltransferase [Anaerolineales bacterium]